jgi:hypothetical protein
MGEKRQGYEKMNWMDRIDRSFEDWMLGRK